MPELTRDEIDAILRGMEQRERNRRELAETFAAIERQREGWQAMFEENDRRAREEARRRAWEDEAQRRRIQREEFAEAERRRRDEWYRIGGGILEMQRRARLGY